MIDRLKVVIVALFFAVPLAAQTGDTHPLNLGDYYLNIPTAQVLARHVWEIRFTHRFAQPINRGDVHSFWGLDSGADVGFGLAWSPMQRLQIGVVRTNLLDDVEMAAKYKLVQQGPLPISLAARVGTDWRTQENIKDRLSPFLQLIITRQFGNRGEFFAVPTYIVNDPLFDHAFNVAIGGAVAVRPGLYVVGELIPENRDVKGSAQSDLFWALGLKRAWGGHFFEVSLSDSRATHVDQYVSSAPIGGIDRSDLHLGFNIERRFGGSK